MSSKHACAAAEPAESCPGIQAVLKSSLAVLVLYSLALQCQQAADGQHVAIKLHAVMPRSCMLA
jgi:hypothetical protein